MDRIELAFRKFDLNHDGFLSRDEFDQVSLKIVINCNLLSFYNVFLKGK